MQNGKKFAITTYSREVFVIKPLRTMTGYCPKCDGDRTLISLDEATLAAQKGTREIIFHADAGSIHSVEADGGQLLICSDSLRKFCEGEL